MSKMATRAKIPRLDVNMEAPQHLPFECVSCGSRFAFWEQLVRHESVHGPNAESSFPDGCILPPLSSLRDGELEEEDGVDGGSSDASASRPTLSCEDCEFTCSQRDEFDEHVRLHESETRKTTSALSMQKRALAREKSFACNACDYKSSRRDHLTKHMRIHSGEKPFACDLCDYKCSQSGHLTVHMRRSHTDAC